MSEVVAVEEPITNIGELPGLVVLAWIENKPHGEVVPMPTRPVAFTVKSVEVAPFCVEDPTTKSVLLKLPMVVVPANTESRPYGDEVPMPTLLDGAMTSDGIDDELTTN